MTKKEVEKFLDRIMGIITDANIELIKLRFLLMDAEEIEDEESNAGDWKLINQPSSGKALRFIECSACGMDVDTTKYTIDEVKEVFNFCPCCGQRMKLDVEFGHCGICKHRAKCWKERIARDGGRYCQQYEAIDSEGAGDNL